MSTRPLGAIEPTGWARPSGYANGISAQGRIVAIAGQIGWDPASCKFQSDDLVGQTRQALANIVSVLRAAGGEPRHLVRLTWYVTDKGAYIEARRELGAVYRETVGAHYPAMSLVVVAALLEDRALVEIEATAVIPE